MEKRTIFITEFDLIRLEGLLEESHAINIRDQKYLNELQNALVDCSVIAPEKVPKNVITMNSEFSVEDPDTGEETKYTVVFPEDADISENKISVLAPIAHWDCRVGVQSWRYDRVERTLRCKKAKD